MRVVERGESVGDHKGRPIPGYIVGEHGERFRFVRVAALDADGRFDLDRLGSDETIIGPGLVYKLHE